MVPVSYTHLELVKIDAKSIGVGQYQHDVDQTLLKKSLDQTVESCVNLVGVNLNTASRHLLTYISGLGLSLIHILRYSNILVLSLGRRWQTQRCRAP